MGETVKEKNKINSLFPWDLSASYQFVHLCLSPSVHTLLCPIHPPTHLSIPSPHIVAHPWVESRGDSVLGAPGEKTLRRPLGDSIGQKPPN